MINKKENLGDMMISIIVPVYNAEKSLKKCVDSLVNQSYKDIEILLINDGSIDNSSKICQEYADTYSSVLYFSKDNSGVSDTRNYGLKKAKGEYIMFVDSDDFVDPTICERLINSATLNGSDLVACGYKVSIGDGYENVIEPCLDKAFKEKNYNHFLLNENKVMGSVWRLLIKRELTNNCKFDENIKICEDLLFTLEIVNKCDKISAVNEYLYYYNLDEIADLTKYFKTKFIKDYYLFVKKLENIVNVDKDVLDFIMFRNWNYICKCKIYDRSVAKLSDFLTKEEIKYLNNKDTYKAFNKLNGGLKGKVFAMLSRHKMFFLLKILQRLIDIKK